MKLILFFVFACTVLSGCGTRQPVPYRVTSAPCSATIEVDGVQVCKNTPCEISPDCDLLFVGLINSPDGFNGSSQRFIDAFPIDGPPGEVQSQSILKNVCLDRFESKPLPINFDLKNLSNLPVQRAEHLVTKKKIQYYGLGVQSEAWSSNKSKDLNSSSQSYSFIFGKEILKYPGYLLIGEIKYNKQVPLETSQQELGASVHFHGDLISMFYLSGGVFYRQIANNYANEGIYPFFGFGLVLNHKTIVEFWNVFKIYFSKPSDFTYKVGELQYDFYLSHDITLQSNRDWQDPRATNFGLRIYY